MRIALAILISYLCPKLNYFLIILGGSRKKTAKKITINVPIKRKV